MKKMTCILLAVVMLFLAALAAADEIPQPEGGVKFESDWAVENGTAEIYYEEEGYRVYIRIERPGDLTGSEFEYSCYYHEDTDSLVSISALRNDYTVNPDTGEPVYEQDNAYAGIDDEGKETVFTIDAEGFLTWKDGHDDAGAGLKFVNIGRFDGVWVNEEEEVEVTFMWNGSDPDAFDYTVYIQRGKIGADHYALFLMTGDYDPATGRLSAGGTCTLFTKNASGEYDSGDDGEYYDAFFSKTPDGKLLFETDNGIELEYDLLGGQG